MAIRKSTPVHEEVSDVLEVTTGTVDCFLIGTSPLIQNRLSEKVKHELLLPRGRKNAVERATTLKHDPIAEYKASVYRIADDAAPTLLALPSISFKGALRTAALDMPGAKKSQIGRLTYIAGETVAIYGVPKLFMRPVRSADMNKTPDIRTRAILPTWACHLSITFVQPLMRAQAVVNLLAASGLTVGVGDWRPEKGSGNYGQFKLVAKTDPEFKAIMKAGGRDAQVAAMESPVAYDDDTTELLGWYDEERAKRALKGVA